MSQNLVEQKILCVLLAISEAAGLTPKGYPICLHPNDMLLSELPLLELRYIMQKLSEDEQIIQMTQYPWQEPASREHDPSRQESEYYKLIPQAGYREYRQLILDKIDEKQNKAKAALDSRRKQNASTSPVIDITAEYAFQNDGATWRVSFEGKSSTFRSTTGFQYIKYLLTHPNREILASELQLASPATLVASTLETSLEGASQEELELQGISIIRSMGGGEMVTDQKAVIQCKQRLMDITDELEQAEQENDLEQIEKLTQDKIQLEQYLSAVLGKGGRIRKVPDSNEKSRQAVSQAIKRAIENIEAQLPKLGVHLSKTIKKGQSFSYMPTKVMIWK